MTADNVIRLAASKDRVVRACATCRYKYREFGSSMCGAVDDYCTIARTDECDGGELWEPKLPMRERIALWWRGPAPR